MVYRKQVEVLFRIEFFVLDLNLGPYEVSLGPLRLSTIGISVRGRAADADMELSVFWYSSPQIYCIMGIHPGRQAIIHLQSKCFTVYKRSDLPIYN